MTIHTSTLEQCFHLGKWYVYIYIKSFWHHLKLLSKATNILRNRTSVYQNNFQIIFVWLQYKKNGRVDVLPYLLTHVDIILCPLVFCGRKYYLTVTIPVMEKSVCVHVCICVHLHPLWKYLQPTPRSFGFLFLLTVMSRGEDTQRLTWFLIDQWPFVWLADSRRARNLKWHLPEAALEH